MAIGYASANLGLHAARHEHRTIVLELLLRFESWLDRRKSSKELYGMDDRTLADIGLSRADVESLNAASWQDHLPSTFSR